MGVRTISALDCHRIHYPRVQQRHLGFHTSHHEYIHSPTGSYRLLPTPNSIPVHTSPMYSSEAVAESSPISLHHHHYQSDQTPAVRSRPSILETSLAEFAQKLLRIAMAIHITTDQVSEQSDLLVDSFSYELLCIIIK